MEAVPRKISNITAGFMIAIAAIFDAIQFFLTLGVISSIFSVLITYFAVCIFGVWFAILRVSYFSGKKKFTKIISALGSTIVELVPIIDGLPAITAGVTGVIVSTRLEERGTSTVTPPIAVNDRGKEYEEAA